MRLPLRRARRLAALWLLLAAAAHAHDALQSSTDIYLRPGDIEVDLTMARVPSRSLAANPPPIPITLDNFAPTYQALLRQNENSLFTVTVNGQPLSPVSADVALSGETDVQFTLHYPRPAAGLFAITASFINRMDDGYLNTLTLSQDQKILASSLQQAGNLTWKYSLGPAAPAPKTSPTQPAGASPPGPAAPTSNHHKLLVLNAVFACIILLAIYCLRQKS